MYAWISDTSKRYKDQQGRSRNKGFNIMLSAQRKFRKLIDGNIFRVYTT